jgi:hypothetical protein
MKTQIIGRYNNPHSGTPVQPLRFVDMKNRRKIKAKGVFRVVTRQLQTYFELLKARFAPHAETDLERAERLARERRTKGSK